MTTDKTTMSTCINSFSLLTCVNISHHLPKGMNDKKTFLASYQAYFLLSQISWGWSAKSVRNENSCQFSGYFQRLHPLWKSTFCTPFPYIVRGDNKNDAIFIISDICYMDWRNFGKHISFILLASFIVFCRWSYFFSCSSNLMLFFGG